MAKQDELVANGKFAADVELREYIEKLEATGDYKVISKFNPVAEYNKNQANKALKIGIYLDVETTGRDYVTDQIIELALVPFEYDAEGRIYKVLAAHNYLQDPGIEIPAIITQLTGIDNDMVRGKSIDQAQVAKALAAADIVIAHNASFDRPFVEKMMPNFATIAWGCSIRDINWAEEGLDGVKLSYLAYRYGFFYAAHRATIDCQVGIEVLANKLFNSGEHVLKRLLGNVNKTTLRLYAQGSPFDKKDMLKARGYRWSPGEKGKHKAWYCDLAETALAAEMDFLNDQVYLHPVKTLPMEKITAKERYSARI